MIRTEKHSQLQRLDLRPFKQMLVDLREELPAVDMETRIQPKQIHIPNNCDDFEKYGVLIRDDLSHKLKTVRLPYCGKCNEHKNGLYFIYGDDQIMWVCDHCRMSECSSLCSNPNSKDKTMYVLKSNTVRLCPSCGAMNRRLINIEKLDLPIEAYGKTLDNFCFNGNEKLRGEAKTQILGGTGLYLHGPYGTGKTHFAYGLARKLVWENNLSVKIINHHDHLTAIKRTYGDNTQKDPMYNWLDKYQVLIVDEFGGGYENGRKRVTEWVRAMTTEMLMEAHRKKVQVIVLTNINTDECLNELLERRAINRLGELFPINYEMQGKGRRPSFF